MSTRAITVLGYLLLLAAGVALELLAIWTGERRIPRLGTVLTRVMRTRTGRVGLLVAWGWVGLHFFAR